MRRVTVTPSKRSPSRLYVFQTLSSLFQSLRWSLISKPGIMWYMRRSLLMGVLIVGAAINGALGAAMVSGIVFCDQCKDGHVSLFDYPLQGVKVAMLCPGDDSQMKMVGEETTNLFGGYTMRFEGTPDLAVCYTQVTGGGGGGGGGCKASAGPAKSLRLIFSFFGMEFYSVDTLLSQPDQPMSSLCPGFHEPPPAPPKSAPKAPPGLRLPPPMPFSEASACSHEYWMLPKYRCYWRVLNPDTRVGVIFGPKSAIKYGRDTTLWVGLQGRADPYRTLLREATTALLNSYNTFQFPYTSLVVVQRFNTALLASPHEALVTALSFKRANTANPSCKFKPCK